MRPNPRYIALGFSVTVPMMFGTGLVESFLVKRGLGRMVVLYCRSTTLHQIP
jgi:hypothetical protein